MTVGTVADGMLLSTPLSLPDVSACKSFECMLPPALHEASSFIDGMKREHYEVKCGTWKVERGFGETSD